MEIFGAKIQESNLQQSLKSTLADQDAIGEMKVGSLKAFIQKVFTEELDPTNRKKFWKSKLSWNSNDKPMAPTDLVVGEWNPRLTCIWGKNWVIQNCKLMNKAGRPISFEDLSDKEHTWVDKAGDFHKAPSDRATAEKAMEVYLKDAVEADPLLCIYCTTYRAKDWDDRMRHLYKKHPAEFAQTVGLPVETQVEVESVIPDEAPAAVEAEGGWDCCGKHYARKANLLAHQRFAKAHKV